MIGKAGAHQNIPVVACPFCQMPVSGNRFAPHLEKCLNGGKRAARSTSSYEAPPPLEKKVKPAPVDPYPQSLIIRIKLKNNGKVSVMERYGEVVELYDAMLQCRSHIKSD
jgi:hypothetical protein